MTEGIVDIRIAYLKQEQLPVEVRPKKKVVEDDLEPDQKRVKNDTA